MRVNKNYMRRAGLVFLVFMSGVNSSNQLTGMGYGAIDQYEASWLKLSFSVFLALLFGEKAIRK